MMKYCDNCSKNSNDFSDMQGFRRHVKSHGGEVTCDHCGKILKNERVAMNHLNIVHNKKEINCEQCKQSFKDKFSFKKHLSIHEVKSKESPKTKNPIKNCDSCDKMSQDFKYIQGFYTL